MKPLNPLSYPIRLCKPYDLPGLFSGELRISQAHLIQNESLAFRYNYNFHLAEVEPI